MPQEVVLYHSGMPGMPVANLQVAGGLVTLLDLVLVNGANSVAVSSLTRSGTVATATTATGHAFAVGDVVLVAGAGESAYNGKAMVTSKPTSNSFTFDVAGSPATPASGTITAKHAPAGWTKTYAGTNVATYTPGAGAITTGSVQVEANNPYNDSNVSVRTRIIQDATAALDGGSHQGEQCRQQTQSGGWIAVADERTCRLFMYAAGGNAYTFEFGEGDSLISGDAFDYYQSRGLISSGNNSYYRNAAGSIQSLLSIGAGHFHPLAMMSFVYADASMGITWLRGVDQMTPNILGAPAPGGAHALPSYQFLDTPTIFDQSIGLPSPDSLVPMVPIFAIEKSGGQGLSVRTRLRGIYAPLGRVAVGAFAGARHLRLADVMVDGVQRSIAIVQMGPATLSQVVIDMTGPW